MAGLPRVAIVGRTNVGKSTLLNRIVGRHRALVDDAPGVTRDRLIAEAEWLGRRFLLIDTGGFEAAPEGGLVARPRSRNQTAIATEASYLISSCKNEKSVSSRSARIREQSLAAARDAEAVVLLVDGRAGIAPSDAEMARLLSRGPAPLVLAVNKIDGPRLDSLASEFFELGVGEPLPVSAEHGYRLDDLLDRIVALLPAGGEAAPESGLRLALVGRPNVGKSSILNRLVGEERVLVDEAPGTTRDSVDTRLEIDGHAVVLVDTAGIRRRSRIERRLEKASVAAAFRALDRAEIALLVVDAAEGVTDQDARLARRAWERGRGLVLVVNKWDLVPRGERDPRGMLEEIRRRYPHFEHVPAVFVSALQGTHVGDILPAARRVETAFRTRVQTRTLNDIVGQATAALEAPLVKGKRARFYYAAQVAAEPPAVALFVNDPARVPTAYLRYLEGRIRAALPLEGVPLRIVLRARTRRQLGAGRPAAEPRGVGRKQRRTAARR